MTGFGNAAQDSETAHVAIELKAVNNRYLKISMRLPDFLARFEADIEKVVRSEIARGSLQLSFRVRLHSESSGYSIDQHVLARYLDQLKLTRQELGLKDTDKPALADLLSLPGVVTESEVSGNLQETLWPVLSSTLKEALQHFHEFRQTEGESMRLDLKQQCQVIESQVAEVARQAPEVVSEYRTKLLDRLSRAVEETNVVLSESDLIREVAIFADKCDVNEEITRLLSHLRQFHDFLDGDKSLGRKLEFLGQEMFREINTIGSKANNVAIAHCVVEMKAAIERIREILQNVE